jgi:hypothetical protein
MLYEQRSDVGIVANPVTPDPGIDQGESQEEEEQENLGISIT